MPRITATILASALIAATGIASAQTGSVPAPVQGGYASTEGPYYDYARVLRVDPVLQQTAPTRVSSNRCYTESDQYASNDGYDDRYDDRAYDSRGYDDRRYDDRRYDDRYDSRYGDRGYGTDTGRNVATVVGGVVGAVLGSKVGGGSARYATAAVGSMVGGMAGRQIYEQTQRDRYVRPGVVRVCDPEPVDGRYGSYRTGGASAYDVTYEYNGRQYTRRMDYHPGDRIRVRVDVSPE